MTDNTPANNEMLETVKLLVRELEAGNQQSADELFTKITHLRESSLFQELGKLTREFHEALNSFRYDERLANLTQADIPDAKERLNYVIKKTDDAAHRTLSALETVMPICDRMHDMTHSLNKDWHKFTQREMGANEFRDLSHKLKDFFQRTPIDVTDIKKNLNDVMLAQDFQDLTGQIIRRVIVLVEELEKSLVNLIKIGSQTANGAKNLVLEEKLAGPQIPGMESETAVKGQDDVDALLSSLGF